MKRLIAILTTVTLIMLQVSCEKDEPNPFLGSWENIKITDISHVVLTMTFRSDMTCTLDGSVTINDRTTTSSEEYRYSYTDTEVTLKEQGKPEETTGYIISGDFLILSPGTEFTWTLTRVR